MPTSCGPSLNTCPKPSFSELVRADLLRHKEGKFSWFSVITHLRRPGFFAVVLYRIASVCALKGSLGKALSMFFGSLNYLLHSCEITPESIIGPGFLLPHPMGVVIGRATLGNNVTIMQNATLGLKRISNIDGLNPAKYPTLGDGVIVSPGAVVLGPIKIGDYALIGANAVVLQDVPAHAVAVGIPARILERREELAP
jgi:serine O-acetyltransferase